MANQVTFFIISVAGIYFTAANTSQIVLTSNIMQAQRFATANVANAEIAQLAPLVANAITVTVTIG